MNLFKLVLLTFLLGACGGSESEEESLFAPSKSTRWVVEGRLHRPGIPGRRDSKHPCARSRLLGE